VRRRPGLPGRAGVALVAAIALLAPLAAPAGPPAARAGGLGDRIAEARARQAGLQRSIERQRELLADLRADEALARGALGATSDSLEGINADQAAVRREIAAAAEALARVGARRDGLADELRRLDWTLALLEGEIADGDAELEQRRRLLGARLAEAYRTQGVSLLEQVLADGSFSDALTTANAYLAYGDQDARLAADIAADQRALDGLRTMAASTRYRTDQLRRETQGVEDELRDQQERLAAARAKLADLEARTRVIQQKQRATFKRIAGNARRARELLEAQAAAERKLERRIAVLVAEAKRQADATASASSSSGYSGGGLSEGSGSFTWPTYGIVSQEFGCTGFVWEPPRGSCAHFHDGIDIVNDEGTPVRAPASGVIAFAGWNPYDGSDPSYIIVMGHAGGYESFFSHLQPRGVVRAGQRVSQGQLIGYMGNTGRSTGTHLHWEVIRGGTPIDPRSVV
jgi:murein DD-endopeptidase MepM/ murein hydrolase activator NlpD